MDPLSVKAAEAGAHPAPSHPLPGTIPLPPLPPPPPGLSPPHAPPQRAPSPLGRSLAPPPTSLVNLSPADPSSAGEQPPSPSAQGEQLPSLACRSAPISACASASGSSHSLLRGASAHAGGPLHGTSFNVGAGAGAGGGPHAATVGRSPLPPSSADLARRLRGLVMSAAVNFRDVELMPQPQPLEADMGLMESMDQHGEEPDADAATGSTAASAALAAAAAAVLGEGDSSTGSGGSGDGSGGAAAAWMAGSGAAGVGGGGGGGATAGAGGGVAGAAEAGGLPAGSSRSGSGGNRLRTSGAVVRKNKLVIIMVGLPGRGKTFLCNKLCCYLNWLGHATRHFNVGSYRRRQKHADELQDAAFFDHANEAGLEARHRALNAALDDLMNWLRSDAGQVAVFDATNTTESRRNLLRSKFHGQWQYLFIETICSDPAVLEQNYRNKMRYSPDYQGVDTDQAVADFLARIAKYEEVYEPINDRNLHYIKLIDMVTGRGHMDINRISGYLPGKIVFFLMQICKSGMTSVRKIWLSRHGESQYNQKGLIGGNSSLSERGERYARLLPEALISRLPQDQPVSVAVWTSTLKRTIETARFLPFPKLRWKALDEIDAGICDGMTYEAIAQKYPQEYEARKKDKLRYRYPSGESYMDVIQRIEPVVIELERERECVVVVAHQAVLRAVYAYFMNVPPDEIPRLSMPLHTLIELTPMPDGTMSEQRFPVNIDRDMGLGLGLGRPGLGPLAVGVAGVAEKQGLERFPSSAAVSVELLASGTSPLSSVNSGASCMQEAGGSLMLPASPAPSHSGGDAMDAEAPVPKPVGAGTHPAAGHEAVAAR